MRVNRAEVVDEQFREEVSRWRVDPPVSVPNPSGYTLPHDVALDLFDAQLTTRHLDLAARQLRARDEGFYTISSAGHEGNVVLGALTRETDPAYLHYRSGAFFVQRSKHAGRTKHALSKVIRDVLLGVVASKEDPASGGRHKVFGSKPLWVLPQTSTIASHLPKAVGAAVAIGRAKRRGWVLPIPHDSIIVCSFGDASLNHASALTGLNAARWLTYQRVPVPILFVCEDNQLGISVKTPPGWVRHVIASQKGIRYVEVDGLDLDDSYAHASEAVAHCRKERCPVFLHLKTVRLLGHAGSDRELVYRPLDEVERDEKHDPLLASARMLCARDILSPSDVLSLYCEKERDVMAIANEVTTRPKLVSVADICEPLAPFHSERVHAEAKRVVDKTELERVYPDGLPGERAERHLALQINAALREMLAKYPRSILFGEDVAKKGGVYTVTSGLHETFGVGRVFNTLLDEQSILGMALGAGHLGLLPVPEIQYLAYLHNANDQIRGEAASMQYFSCDQFRNPMVVRIASFAYQRGFGGHFHNDNTVAPLRDIPGVVIACPARGDDAARILRTAFALAQVDGRVVLVLEPIALYMQKDLYEAKDGLFSANYPEQGDIAMLGEGRLYHEGANDLTMVTYGNGVLLSLRAAKVLREQHGIHASVYDLRWLSPLNHDAVFEQASKAGRVLVVDETRETGGLSEGIITGLVERGFSSQLIGRVNAQDTFIPLGAAAFAVLPSDTEIVTAARKLCTSKKV